MKKIFTIALLAILGLFSCKKILDKLLTFTYKDSVNISIPATTIVNTPFTIATPDITSNASEEFENNGASVDNVKSVSISEMKLTITSPDGQTFNFMKSIEIYMSADGLDDVLIAQKSNMGNDDLTVLDLEVTNADFSDHIKKDKYKLTVSLTTDEILTQKVDITSDLTFKVTAKVL